MIAAVLSLGGIGLLAAVALGFAAKKFAVEVDPRELVITSYSIHYTKLYEERAERIPLRIANQPIQQRRFK